MDEISAAMAELEAASKIQLVEALISASGTLYSLMNGKPGTSREMELFAVQVAAEFVKDNQAVAVEAEALSTIDSATATVN